MAAEIEDPDRTANTSFNRRVIVFSAIVLIIAAAIVRSSITTSLDSFTFDEAYHVGAGASYIQTGDFRLNPEHPPLTKLWVGAYVTALGYTMSPFRSYSDKGDERNAVEEDAYFKNDPDVLQHRTRNAMFTLNAILIFIFVLAVRRVFGEVMAIAAAAYVAIDPTVAAHLPVMMTDLPVGLTSGAAVLFAMRAFCDWKPIDLVAVAVTLGLALMSKHSAVITAMVIALIGLGMAAVFVRNAGVTTRLKRSAMVVAIMVGAVVVLWSSYTFRFHETPGTKEETFNRPLATKITDIKSPLYRSVLNIASAGRLLPRAYLWGLADTIRAGAEGRAIPILAFGEMYYSKGPFYYFPGVIAAKLPIGLLVLSIFGAGILIFARPPEFPIAAVAGLAVLAAAFLLFLMMGSSYGGVRHALPIYPLMVVLGSVPVYEAVRRRSYVFGGACALLFLAALVSAVPVMRPWEYFNEFAGGTANAYKYFSDEGVDLGLRLKEIGQYYDAHLKPSGEVPFLIYFSSTVDRRWRGIDYVGRDPERDAARIAGETVAGTFIAGGPELSPKLWWDVAAPLRGAEPIARFGNVFVFRGTFQRPTGAIARNLYNRAVYRHLYVPEPNVIAGIELLEQSLQLDPAAFHVGLELGNQYLKLGKRADALRTYRMAYERAPRTDSIHQILAEQVRRVESEPLESIGPLRNPGVE